MQLLRTIVFTILPMLMVTTTTAAPEEGFNIEVVQRGPDPCPRKSEAGDTISVHYRGTLAKDGSQFDASYDRGQPLSFVVGKGMVIKGWEEGLLGMCIGEKRKLTIPPSMAYGDRAMGPIPASSTLIFDTELMDIKGPKDEL